MIDPGAARVLDKVISAMERASFAPAYTAEARAALKAEMKAAEEPASDAPITKVEGVEGISAVKEPDGTVLIGMDPPTGQSESAEMAGSTPSNDEGGGA